METQNGLNKINGESETHSTDNTRQTPQGRPRILDLFESARKDGRPLHVCAPMVRYSKLPFRMLLRDYAVDIAYTPMMLAHEFVRSSIARDSDFTTCAVEREDSTHDARPHVIIAQFAASDPQEFARAADLIAPWVDGIDLNCGCPQSWALKEGIGCSLMEDPDLVASMVTAARKRFDQTIGSSPRPSISCKIRIHPDLTRTLLWVRTVEAAGVDFITVHGRLRSQRSTTPPNYDAIRFIKSHAKVPVIANGDAYSLADVHRIASSTGVDGVMVARGLLENPAMFAGHDTVPAECVRNFIEYAVKYPIPFALVLHHVGEMTARMPDRTKKERRRLMDCRDLIELIDFVEEKYAA